MHLCALLGGENAVPEVQVGHRHFREAVHKDGLLGTGANNVAHVHVAEFRGGLVHGLDVCGVIVPFVTGGDAGIIQVEDDAVGDDVFHVNVVAPDVFHHAATAAGALETKAHIRTQEAAAAHPDVFHTAAHFRAHHKAAMAVVHGAVLDNQVFAGLGMAPAVGVFAALDANGIVPHIETGAGENHILAAFDVYAVAVGGIVRGADADVPDGDILAPEGVQVPAGGILEGSVFQEHPLAVTEAEHDGAKEGLDPLFVQALVLEIKAAGGFAGGHVAFVRIPDAAVLRQHAAALENGFPGIVPHLAALDLPPGVAVSVNDALAGNGNVRGAFRVERRQAAAHIQAFKIGVDDGIQALVRGENDNGILVQVQLDMALQADRSGEPDTGRHLQAAAAQAGELVDGLGKGLRIQRNAVPHCAKIRQAHAAVRDGRELDTGHFEGNAFIQTGFRGGTAGRCKQGNGTCVNQG